MGIVAWTVEEANAADAGMMPPASRQGHPDDHGAGDDGTGRRPSATSPSPLHAADNLGDRC